MSNQFDRFIKDKKKRETAEDKNTTHESNDLPLTTLSKQRMYLGDSAC